MAKKETIVKYNNKRVKIEQPNQSEGTSTAFLKPGDVVDLPLSVDGGKLIDDEGNAIGVLSAHGDVQLIFNNGSILDFASLGVLLYDENKPVFKDSTGNVIELLDYITTYRYDPIEQDVLSRVVGDQYVTNQSSKIIQEIVEGSKYETDESLGNPEKSIGTVSITQKGLESNIKSPGASTIRSLYTEISEFVYNSFTTDIFGKTNSEYPFTGNIVETSNSSVISRATYGQEYTNRDGNYSVVYADNNETSATTFTSYDSMVDFMSGETATEINNGTNLSARYNVSSESGKATFGFRLALESSTTTIYTFDLSKVNQNGQEWSVNTDFRSGTEVSNVEGADKYEAKGFSLSYVYFEITITDGSFSQSSVSFDLSYKYTDRATLQVIENTMKQTFNFISNESDLAASEGGEEGDGVSQNTIMPTGYRVTFTGTDTQNIVDLGDFFNTVEVEGGDDIVLDGASGSVVSLGAGNDKYFAGSGASFVTNEAGKAGIYYSNANDGELSSASGNMGYQLSTHFSSASVTFHLGATGIFDKVQDFLDGSSNESINRMLASIQDSVRNQSAFYTTSGSSSVSVYSGQNFSFYGSESSDVFQIEGTVANNDIVYLYGDGKKEGQAKDGALITGANAAGALNIDFTDEGKVEVETSLAGTTTKYIYDNSVPVTTLGEGIADLHIDVADGFLNMINDNTQNTWVIENNNDTRNFVKFQEVEKVFADFSKNNPTVGIDNTHYVKLVNFTEMTFVTGELELTFGQDTQYKINAIADDLELLIKYQDLAVQLNLNDEQIASILQSEVNREGNQNIVYFNDKVVLNAEVAAGSKVVLDHSSISKYNNSVISAIASSGSRERSGFDLNDISQGSYGQLAVRFAADVVIDTSFQQGEDYSITVQDFDDFDFSSAEGVGQYTEYKFYINSNDVDEQKNGDYTFNLDQDLFFKSDANGKITTDFTNNGITYSSNGITAHWSDSSNNTVQVSEMNYTDAVTVDFTFDAFEWSTWFDAGSTTSFNNGAKVNFTVSDTNATGHTISYSNSMVNVSNQDSGEVGSMDIGGADFNSFTVSCDTTFDYDGVADFYSIRVAKDLSDSVSNTVVFTSNISINRVLKLDFNSQILAYADDQYDFQGVKTVNYSGTLEGSGSVEIVVGSSQDNYKFDFSELAGVAEGSVSLLLDSINSQVATVNLSITNDVPSVYVLNAEIRYDNFSIDALNISTLKLSSSMGDIINVDNLTEAPTVYDYYIIDAGSGEGDKLSAKGTDLSFTTSVSSAIKYKNINILDYDYSGVSNTLNAAIAPIEVAYGDALSGTLNSRINVTSSNAAVNTFHYATSVRAGNGATFNATSLTLQKVSSSDIKTSVFAQESATQTVISSIEEYAIEGSSSVFNNIIIMRQDSLSHITLRKLDSTMSVTLKNEDDSSSTTTLVDFDYEEGTSGSQYNFAADSILDDNNNPILSYTDQYILHSVNTVSEESSYNLTNDFMLSLKDTFILNTGKDATITIGYEVKNIDLYYKFMINADDDLRTFSINPDDNELGKVKEFQFDFSDTIGALEDRSYSFTGSYSDNEFTTFMDIDDNNTAVASGTSVIYLTFDITPQNLGEDDKTYSLIADGTTKYLLIGTHYKLDVTQVIDTSGLPDKGMYDYFKRGVINVRSDDNLSIDLDTLGGGGIAGDDYQSLFNYFSIQADYKAGEATISFDDDIQPQDFKLVAGTFPIYSGQFNAESRYKFDKLTLDNTDLGGIVIHNTGGMFTEDAIFQAKTDDNITLIYSDIFSSNNSEKVIIKDAKGNTTIGTDDYALHFDALVNMEYAINDIASDINMEINLTGRQKNITLLNNPGNPSLQHTISLNSNTTSTLKVDSSGGTTWVLSLDGDTQETASKVIYDSLIETTKIIDISRFAEISISEEFIDNGANFQRYNANLTVHMVEINEFQSFIELFNESTLSSLTLLSDNDELGTAETQDIDLNGINLAEIDIKNVNEGRTFNIDTPLLADNLITLSDTNVDITYNNTQHLAINSGKNNTYSINSGFKSVQATLHNSGTQRAFSLAVGDSTQQSDLSITIIGAGSADLVLKLTQSGDAAYLSDNVNGNDDENTSDIVQEGVFNISSSIVISNINEIMFEALKLMPTDTAIQALSSSITVSNTDQMGELNNWRSLKMNELYIKDVQGDFNIESVQNYNIKFSSSTINNQDVTILDNAITILKYQRGGTDALINVGEHSLIFEDSSDASTKLNLYFASTDIEQIDLSGEISNLPDVNYYLKLTSQLKITSPTTVDTLSLTGGNNDSLIFTAATAADSTLSSVVSVELVSDDSLINYQSTSISTLSLDIRQYLNSLNAASRVVTLDLAYISFNDVSLTFSGNRSLTYNSLNHIDVADPNSGGTTLALIKLSLSVVSNTVVLEDSSTLTLEDTLQSISKINVKGMSVENAVIYDSTEPVQAYDYSYDNDVSRLTDSQSNSGNELNVEGDNVVTEITTGDNLRTFRFHTTASLALVNASAADYHVALPVFSPGSSSSNRIVLDVYSISDANELLEDLNANTLVFKSASVNISTLTLTEDAKMLIDNTVGGNFEGTTDLNMRFASANEESLSIEFVPAASSFNMNGDSEDQLSLDTSSLSTSFDIKDVSGKRYFFVNMQAVNPGDSVVNLTLEYQLSTVVKAVDFSGVSQTILVPYVASTTTAVGWFNHSGGVTPTPDVNIGDVAVATTRGLTMQVYYQKGEVNTEGSNLVSLNSIFNDYSGGVDLEGKYFYPLARQESVIHDPVLADLLEEDPGGNSFLGTSSVVAILGAKEPGQIAQSFKYNTTPEGGISLDIVSSNGASRNINVENEQQVFMVGNKNNGSIKLSIDYSNLNALHYDSAKEVYNGAVKDAVINLGFMSDTALQPYLGGGGLYIPIISINLDTEGKPVQNNDEQEKTIVLDFSGFSNINGEQQISSSTAGSVFTLESLTSTNGYIFTIGEAGVDNSAIQSYKVENHDEDAEEMRFEGGALDLNMSVASHLINIPSFPTTFNPDGITFSLNNLKISTSQDLDVFAVSTSVNYINVNTDMSASNEWIIINTNGNAKVALNDIIDSNEDLVPLRSEAGYYNYVFDGDSASSASSLRVNISSNRNLGLAQFQVAGSLRNSPFTINTTINTASGSPVTMTDGVAYDLAAFVSTANNGNIGIASGAADLVVDITDSTNNNYLLEGTTDDYYQYSLKTGGYIEIKNSSYLPGANTTSKAKFTAGTDQYIKVEDTSNVSFGNYTNWEFSATTVSFNVGLWTGFKGIKVTDVSELSITASGFRPVPTAQTTGEISAASDLLNLSFNIQDLEGSYHWAIVGTAVDNLNVTAVYNTAPTRNLKDESGHVVVSSADEVFESLLDMDASQTINDTLSLTSSSTTTGMTLGVDLEILQWGSNAQNITIMTSNYAGVAIRLGDLPTSIQTIDVGTGADKYTIVSYFDSANTASLTVGTAGAADPVLYFTDSAYIIASKNISSSNQYDNLQTSIYQVDANFTSELTVRGEKMIALHGSSTTASDLKITSPFIGIQRGFDVSNLTYTQQLFSGNPYLVSQYSNTDAATNLNQVIDSNMAARLRDTFGLTYDDTKLASGGVIDNKNSFTALESSIIHKMTDGLLVLNVVGLPSTMVDTFTFSNMGDVAGRIAFWSNIGYNNSVTLKMQDVVTDKIAPIADLEAAGVLLDQTINGINFVGSLANTVSSAGDYIGGKTVAIAAVGELHLHMRPGETSVDGLFSGHNMLIAYESDNFTIEHTYSGFYAATGGLMAWQQGAFGTNTIDIKDNVLGVVTAYLNIRNVNIEDSNRFYTGNGSLYRFDMYHVSGSVNYNDGSFNTEGNPVNLNFNMSLNDTETFRVNTNYTHLNIYNGGNDQHALEFGVEYMGGKLDSNLDYNKVYTFTGWNSITVYTNEEDGNLLSNRSHSMTFNLAVLNGGDLYQMEFTQPTVVRADHIIVFTEDDTAKTVEIINNIPIQDTTSGFEYIHPNFVSQNYLNLTLNIAHESKVAYNPRNVDDMTAADAIKKDMVIDGSNMGINLTLTNFEFNTSAVYDMGAAYYGYDSTMTIKGHIEDKTDYNRTTGIYISQGGNAYDGNLSYGSVLTLNIATTDITGFAAPIQGSSIITAGAQTVDYTYEDPVSSKSVVYNHGFRHKEIDFSASQNKDHDARNFAMLVALSTFFPWTIRGPAESDKFKINDGVVINGVNILTILRSSRFSMNDAQLATYSNVQLSHGNANGRIQGSYSGAPLNLGTDYLGNVNDAFAVPLGRSEDGEFSPAVFSLIAPHGDTYNYRIDTIDPQAQDVDGRITASSLVYTYFLYRVNFYTLQLHKYSASIGNDAGNPYTTDVIAIDNQVLDQSKYIKGDPSDPSAIRLGFVLLTGHENTNVGGPNDPERYGYKIEDIATVPQDLILLAYTPIRQQLVTSEIIEQESNSMALSGNSLYWLLGDAQGSMTLTVKEVSLADSGFKYSDIPEFDLNIKVLSAENASFIGDGSTNKLHLDVKEDFSLDGTKFTGLHTVVIDAYTIDIMGKVELEGASNFSMDIAIISLTGDTDIIDLDNTSETKISAGNININDNILNIISSNVILQAWAISGNELSVQSDILNTNIEELNVKSLDFNVSSDSQQLHLRSNITNATDLNITSNNVVISGYEATSLEFEDLNDYSAEEVSHHMATNFTVKHLTVNSNSVNSTSVDIFSLKSNISELSALNSNVSIISTGGAATSAVIGNNTSHTNNTFNTLTIDNVSNVELLGHYKYEESLSINSVNNITLGSEVKASGITGGDLSLVSLDSAYVNINFTSQSEGKVNLSVNELLTYKNITLLNASDITISANTLTNVVNGSVLNNSNINLSSHGEVKFNIVSDLVLRAKEKSTLDFSNVDNLNFNTDFSHNLSLQNVELLLPKDIIQNFSAQNIEIRDNFTITNITSTLTLTANNKLDLIGNNSSAKNFNLEKGNDLVIEASEVNIVNEDLNIGQSSAVNINAGSINITDTIVSDITEFIVNISNRNNNRTVNIDHLDVVGDAIITVADASEVVLDTLTSNNLTINVSLVTSLSLDITNTSASVSISIDSSNVKQLLLHDSDDSIVTYDISSTGNDISIETVSIVSYNNVESTTNSTLSITVKDSLLLNIYNHTNADSNDNGENIFSNSQWNIVNNATFEIHLSTNSQVTPNAGSFAIHAEEMTNALQSDILAIGNNVGGDFTAEDISIDRATSGALGTVSQSVDAKHALNINTQTLDITLNSLGNWNSDSSINADNMNAAGMSDFTEDYGISFNSSVIEEISIANMLMGAEIITNDIEEICIGNSLAQVELREIYNNFYLNHGTNNMVQTDIMLNKFADSTYKFTNTDGSNLIITNLNANNLGDFKAVSVDIEQSSKVAVNQNVNMTLQMKDFASIGSVISYNVSANWIQSFSEGNKLTYSVEDATKVAISQLSGAIDMQLENQHNGQLNVDFYGIQNSNTLFNSMNILVSAKELSVDLSDMQEMPSILMTGDVNTLEIIDNSREYTLDNFSQDGVLSYSIDNHIITYDDPSNANITELSVDLGNTKSEYFTVDDFNNTNIKSVEYRLYQNTLSYNVTTDSDAHLVNNHHQQTALLLGSKLGGVSTDNSNINVTFDYTHNTINIIHNDKSTLLYGNSVDDLLNINKAMSGGMVHESLYNSQVSDSSRGVVYGLYSSEANNNMIADLKDNSGMYTRNLMNVKMGDMYTNNDMVANNIIMGAAFVPYYTELYLTDNLQLDDNSSLSKSGKYAALDLAPLQNYALHPSDKMLNSMVNAANSLGNIHLVFSTRSGSVASDSSSDLATFSDIGMVVDTLGSSASKGGSYIHTLNNLVKSGNAESLQSLMMLGFGSVELYNLLSNNQTQYNLSDSAMNMFESAVASSSETIILEENISHSFDGDNNESTDALDLYVASSSIIEFISSLSDSTFDSKSHATGVLDASNLSHNVLITGSSGLAFSISSDHDSQAVHLGYTGDNTGVVSLDIEEITFITEGGLITNEHIGDASTHRAEGLIDLEAMLDSTSTNHLSFFMNLEGEGDSNSALAIDDNAGHTLSLDNGNFVLLGRYSGSRSEVNDIDIYGNHNSHVRSLSSNHDGFVMSVGNLHGEDASMNTGAVAYGAYGKGGSSDNNNNDFYLNHASTFENKVMTVNANSSAEQYLFLTLSTIYDYTGLSDSTASDLQSYFTGGVVELNSYGLENVVAPQHINIDLRNHSNDSYIIPVLASNVSDYIASHSADTYTTGLVLASNTDQNTTEFTIKVGHVYSDGNIAGNLTSDNINMDAEINILINTNEASNLHIVLPLGDGMMSDVNSYQNVYQTNASKGHNTHEGFAQAWHDNYQISHLYDIAEHNNVSFSSVLESNLQNLDYATLQLAKEYQGIQQSLLMDSVDNRVITDLNTLISLNSDSLVKATVVIDFAEQGDASIDNNSFISIDEMDYIVKNDNKSQSPENDRFQIFSIEGVTFLKGSQIYTNNIANFIIYDTETNSGKIIDVADMSQVEANKLYDILKDYYNISDENSLKGTLEDILGMMQSYEGFLEMISEFIDIEKSQDFSTLDDSNISTHDVSTDDLSASDIEDSVNDGSILNTHNDHEWDVDYSDNSEENDDVSVDTHSGTSYNSNDFNLLLEAEEEKREFGTYAADEDANEDDEFIFEDYSNLDSLLSNLDVDNSSNANDAELLLNHTNIQNLDIEDAQDHYQADYASSMADNLEDAISVEHTVDHHHKDHNKK